MAGITISLYVLGGAFYTDFGDNETKSNFCIAMKHIVCFSGGHSSALVAIEVVRRYSKNNVILLNHDINPKYEHQDIKRFKQEIADYLELPITYANILGIQDLNKIPSQFQVCMIAKAFKVSNGQELCTNRLKTSGFVNYLNQLNDNAIIYYGFDAKEKDRIARRRKIIKEMGFDSVYPLAEWKQTIKNIQEVGIKPPCVYTQFKHANCVGCLKAGKQHWYIVYCTRPDVWGEAKTAEDYIGYSIHPGEFLRELEPQFEAMKLAGITPTEHLHSNKFWSLVQKSVPGIHIQQSLNLMPCECVV